MNAALTLPAPSLAPSTPRRVWLAAGIPLLLAAWGVWALLSQIGTAPSEAELIQWGAQAQARDEHATTVLRNLARNGLTPAMPLLGRVLVQRGDARSVAEGRDWLQHAAEAGDATAALHLGKLWFKGAPGLPANADQALPWLKQAADHGQEAAAHYVALILKNGSPQTPAHPEAAARWMRRAAEAGWADSQFLLGQMLLHGQGVKADPMEARAWFERAAEQDHPEANLQLLLAQTHAELGLHRQAETEAERWREAQHALKHRPEAP
jgi:TPR repeat protein